MRSPEAVFECAAYQDAPPHPFEAEASIGAITTEADIVAEIAIQRVIIFKTDCPSTLLNCAPLAVALKSSQKWRKSARIYHGLLQTVIFRIESEYD